MRRADRLFLLIQALRGRRAVTAARLAELLEVSVRTVYRDVQDLQLSGVPIEGEAGVGYVLRRGADIPPLMFTEAELESLIVGARFVEAFASPALAQAAKHALTKIEAVLPDEMKRRSERSRILAPRSESSAAARARMGELHAAIGERRVVRIAYVREDGESSERVLEPLALVFWGQVWTLAAWCRLRVDFRTFRVDRISACEVLDERFRETRERGLRAYLERAGAGDDVEW